MNKDDKKTLKTKPINYIYMGIIFILITVLIIFFFYSIKFITKNINKILFTETNTEIQILDINNYNLVSKKLNLTSQIDIVKIEENNIIEDTLQIEEIKEEINPLDKKILTLNILNGARKAGVASLLSSNLEKDGFPKAITGDNPKIYPVTTMLIKESKKDYTQIISESIKKYYPSLIISSNPEASEFDVIIIVGKK